MARYQQAQNLLEQVFNDEYKGEDHHCQANVARHCQSKGEGSSIERTPPGQRENVRLVERVLTGSRWLYPLR